VDGVGQGGAVVVIWIGDNYKICVISAQFSIFSGELRGFCTKKGMRAQNRPAQSDMSWENYNVYLLDAITLTAF
jgi:hypothetical protein